MPRRPAPPQSPISCSGALRSHPVSATCLNALLVNPGGRFGLGAITGSVRSSWYTRRRRRHFRLLGGGEYDDDDEDEGGDDEEGDEGEGGGGADARLSMASTTDRREDRSLWSTACDRSELEFEEEEEEKEEKGVGVGAGAGGGDSGD
jgi:hypothetical protein